MERVLAIVLLIGAATAYPFDVSPTIVGGRDAREHEAPYMLSFQVDRQLDGNFVHVCGASILTPMSALTAAQCYTEVGRLLLYQIVAGDHDLNGEEGQEQTRAVMELHLHERFVGGPTIGPFDIMVIRFESALTLVPGVVETIRLPPAGVVPTGQAILFGWGSTSRSATPSFPDILQTVSKTIFSFELCRELANAVVGLHEPLNPSNFCTNPFDLSTSACDE